MTLSDSEWGAILTRRVGIRSPRRTSAGSGPETTTDGPSRRQRRSRRAGTGQRGKGWRWERWWWVVLSGERPRATAQSDRVSRHRSRARSLRTIRTIRTMTPAEERDSCDAAEWFTKVHKGSRSSWMPHYVVRRSQPPATPPPPPLRELGERSRSLCPSSIDGSPMMHLRRRSLDPTFATL